MLINKIGIMCKLFYNNNNKTYNPINIIIPKHTQKVDISKINKGEKIYIKVIGFKFNKNSTFIQSIADIVSDDEISNIKSLSKIIQKLVNINLSFEIDNKHKLNKFSNIVKFILNKSTITKQHLFIYEFILLKNINSNTKNYIDLYNEYIKEYQLKKEEQISDINYNSNLESESNIDNIYELETNDTDILLDKSSNIDEDHEPDDDDDEDEDEDEDETIKMELLNDIDDDSDDDTNSDSNTDSDIDDEPKETEESEIETKLVLKEKNK